MCGHLHRLFLGIGNTMYAHHKFPDLLELELSDMKEHAIYRIVAVDNDMISFSDQTLGLASIPAPLTNEITEPHPASPSRVPFDPVIIITNPICKFLGLQNL